MRIAIGTKHVKIISKEHTSTPMTPQFGAVCFLLCMLAAPVVLIWVAVTSGFVTGLESAGGVILGGLLIGIKAGTNAKKQG